MVRNFFKDKSSATTVGPGLTVASIAMVITTALSLLGRSLTYQGDSSLLPIFVIGFVAGGLASVLLWDSLGRN